MTTAARRYTRHRWLVYGKIGMLTATNHALSGLSDLVPSTRRYVDEATITLDNLHLILIEHLREMKATGSWRKL